MSSNEEYLDSLLSSLIATGEDEDLPQDQEIAAGAAETSEFALEEIPEEDDILSMLSADAGGYAAEERVEQNVQEDGLTPDGEPDEMSLDDIDAMLASLAGDTSLEEVEESGNTTDSVSTADDDMLAMLESLPDGDSAEEAEELDFDFFSGEEEYLEEDVDESSGEAWEEEESFAAEQGTEDMLDVPEESLDMDAISEAIGVQSSPFEELGAEESSAETAEAAEDKKEKRRFFKDRKKKNKDSEQAKEKQTDEIPETEDAYEDMDVLESVLQSAQEEEAVEEEPEKKSVWKRLLDFLMEEEEEEEDADAEEELPIGNPSEENLELLDELSAEDKKKDKKKNKKKKGKKGKEKDTEEAVDEETEEETAEPEKKKKKRKKKEKAAEEGQKQEPEKKLSKKKVLTVFAFCGTIALCILLLNKIFPETMEKRDARVAYDQQNYEVAYDLFVGKKLNEDDELIFQKSSVIMQMKHIQKEYEVYRTLEKNLEALDVLVRAVSNYSEMQRKAEKYNVEAQVQEIYDEILQTLEQDFGVTQEDALDAAASEDDVTYTKKLTAMVSGFAYDPESGEIMDEKQDILPEEEEFLMEMQN